MHVGDLYGFTLIRSTSWSGRVTVYVHSSAHGALRNVRISGAWGADAAGTASCLTGTRGYCTVTSPKLPFTATTVTFTITGLSRSGYFYDAPSNHDPDGSSDGTTVAIVR